MPPPVYTRHRRACAFRLRVPLEGFALGIPRRFEPNVERRFEQNIPRRFEQNFPRRFEEIVARRFEENVLRRFGLDISRRFGLDVPRRFVPGWMFRGVSSRGSYGSLQAGPSCACVVDLGFEV